MDELEAPSKPEEEAKADPEQQRISIEDLNHFNKNPLDSLINPDPHLNKDLVRPSEVVYQAESSRCSQLRPSQPANDNPISIINQQYMQVNQEEDEEGDINQEPIPYKKERKSALGAFKEGGIQAQDAPSTYMVNTKKP